MTRRFGNSILPGSCGVSRTEPTSSVTTGCFTVNESILLTLPPGSPSSSNRKFEATNCFCAGVFVAVTFPLALTSRVYSGANFNVRWAASLELASRSGMVTSVMSAW